MKIVVLLVSLANVVLFMWEFKQGAFEHDVKSSVQHGQEQILLVGELKAEQVKGDVDFTSLYPPGLDPLANNLLTESFVLEDFTGELLISEEPGLSGP
ncbi:MAG: hypothetical protein ISR72_08260 [Methylobacter sp.]|nr:hypothetical protein [Methylobacter sp.]